MLNSSNNISTISQYETTVMIGSYYPLILIVIGTVLNILTFMTLCRAPFKNTRTRPTIHYMLTIAIFDILILYGWHLENYLNEVHGFSLRLYSEPCCKFFTFLNYFASQVSAWLRVFICITLHNSLMCGYHTWFKRTKTIIIIIVCNIFVFTMINLHFLISPCLYDILQSVNIHAQLYQVDPLWDYVNLVIYNFLPFILMVSFNSSIIYNLINRASLLQNQRIRHHSITVTLVIQTCLFLIMTTPATIVYGFFRLL